CAGRSRRSPCTARSPAARWVCTIWVTRRRSARTSRAGSPRPRRSRPALDRAGARLTVVLGGGHETAWSSYLGLVGSGLGPRAGQRWGVLNLDAHFDLREEARPTSGTPFAQMAAAEQQVGRELHYAVLGIA